MSDPTIQQALEQALEHARPPEDGYSIVELMELTTWCQTRVRSAIRSLLKDGLWEVARTRRRNMAGSWQVVPVYRPKATGRRKRQDNRR